MNTNEQNRNVTITSKVTAFQKATFCQKAKENDLSLSEWISISLDLGKNNFEDINKPIERMLKLEEENVDKDKTIKRLTTDLENADTYINFLESKTHIQEKENLNLKKVNLRLSMDSQNIVIEKPTSTTKNGNEIPQISKALYTTGTISLLLGVLFFGNK